MLLRSAVAPPSRHPPLSTSLFHGSSRTLTLTRTPPRRFPSVLSSPVAPSKPSPLLAVAASCESHPRIITLPFPFSSPLAQIAPFLRIEWEAVLKGWLCSIVAVSCLCRAVPKLGHLPSLLADIRSPLVLREGGVLVALACARSAAAYLQQAYLLEAATRSVWRLRVHVFDRVLQRDMAFFEGKDAILAGDVAYRMTAEAADVSDALHAILNVLPSMLVVKANVGESKESLRFQRLAYDNLVFQLKKKKMKALIPQLVQALYVGGLLVLCAGSVVVSRNSCDCSSYLSFVTALTLLIEPIKGVGKAYNELKQGEPAIERLLDLTRFKPKVFIIIGCHLYKLEDKPKLSMLFSGTVAENIGYRDLTGQINQENVENAARIANADEFIATLAKGYATNIGQAGSLLSGGQKQR
ncbi:hypothetical protein B296_00026945 [Ensete ventricosum]|uniref:ABC transmembrane type-1 domain-containing protein n=1 Tax=Ensete ventricosum TaxID=4639 RepID=A0A426YG36_ENSVE|nr:hypothetical protein B296_00026945 [Ensete ventricosum]